MGMIQTESPYYPPDPQAPAPFNNSLGAFNADPDFSNCVGGGSHCAVSWALRIAASSNIQIAGAGLYSWFQDHNQACVDTQNCQQSLVSTYLSSDIWLYNLITIGSIEMVSPYGSAYSAALAKDNTDSTGHPFWSVISAWLLLADGAISDQTPTPGQTITLPDWFWAMPSPSISCW
jgi:glucan 1,3-beta-glucosidase